MTTATHPSSDGVSERFRRWRLGYYRSNGQVLRKTVDQPGLFGRWLYHSRLHYGAAAWYGLGAVALAGRRRRLLRAWLATSVAAFAAVSVPAPWEEGFYYLSYVNNQRRPTLGLALSRLPGLVIYLSQDVEFRAPVRLGDRVTAEVEAVESLGGGRFRLRTLVKKGEDVVIDGEAVILVD